MTKIEELPITISAKVPVTQKDNVVTVKEVFPIGSREIKYVYKVKNNYRKILEPIVGRLIEPIIGRLVEVKDNSLIVSLSPSKRKSLNPSLLQSTVAAISENNKKEFEFVGADFHVTNAENLMEITTHPNNITIDEIRAYKAEMISSREASIKFLERVGVIKNGKITPAYIENKNKVSYRYCNK